MRLPNNGLVRGALAGAIATVPMTLVMTRLIGNRPLPPERITANAANKAGARLAPDEFNAAATINHFGFGAFCGIAYSILMKRWGARPEVKGPLFALGVWAVSYFGWVPALRLMPNAVNRPQQENFAMIASHLVWGLSFSRLFQRPTSEMVGEVMNGIQGSTTTAKLAQKMFA